MKNKVIVIGASTVGKTELVKYFRDHFSNFTVSESDEELTALNGGKYPLDLL